MNKEQYIEGIKLLSPIQIDFLKTIYYNENHAATAKEIASLRGYKSYQGANATIGKIGKDFSKIGGVKLETYPHTSNDERPAYYRLVGEYYEDGWKMNRELCEALELMGIVSEDETASVERLPTEISDFEDRELREGKVVNVKVDRYERNPIARQKCIQHFGVACQVCGFDFGKVYGKDAEGFINVHHIKPISETGEEHNIDPIKDLIPLCSNCHSAIHLTKPVMTVPELKKLIQKNIKQNE